MNWTRLNDIRTQLQKMWDKNLLLTSLITDESLFPRRLIFKAPDSKEIAEHFDAVRAWITELKAMPYCRIEMREFKHRILGANSIPAEIWVDSFEDAIRLIGKGKEVWHFDSMRETVLNRYGNSLSEGNLRCSRLLDWLAKKPLHALSLCDEWHRLLDVIDWIICHPRPGCYLRQVDIPDVHSKFIEAHRSVLMELLDSLLPLDAIDLEYSGVSGFARRYGFLDKPLRIRFRVLDPDLNLLGEDITLDALSFAKLDLKLSKIFITENEINFLAFPNLKDSLVIFGAGYGFDGLRKALWLSRCRIYYWGDIDTHGFAILDQLRSTFDHVESFLMDRSTLFEFEAYWGKEEKQTLRDLQRLTLDERALYDDLRDHKICKNLRLEQERIGFNWVKSALSL